MPSKPSIPENWPTNLIYLSHPLFTPALQKDVQLMSVLQPCKANKALPPSNAKVRIQKITSPSHPAYNQYGLFATQPLKQDEHILDYLGLYHLPLDSDSDATSDYDLGLRHIEKPCATYPSGLDVYVDVDAAKMGNEARMINDYRGGVRDGGPNARFESFLDGTGRLRMGVWVVSEAEGVKGGKKGKRWDGIRKGEEICVNYGKGFWRKRWKKDDEEVTEGDATAEG